MIKNILTEFEQINEYWSPKIVGEYNDSYIKIAKIKGEFTWHFHQSEDEVFYIIKGQMIMQYKKDSVLLKEQDLHVVPKGVEHNPLAEEECWIMLMEQKTTINTGNVTNEFTKKLDEQK